MPRNAKVKVNKSSSVQTKKTLLRKNISTQEDNGLLSIRKRKRVGLKKIKMRKVHLEKRQ